MKWGFQCIIGAEFIPLHFAKYKGMMYKKILNTEHNYKIGYCNLYLPLCLVYIIPHYNAGVFYFYKPDLQKDDKNE